MYARKKRGGNLQQRGERVPKYSKFCGRQISFLPRLRRMLKKARDISMTTMRAPCPRVGDSEKSEGIGQKDYYFVRVNSICCDQGTGRTHNTVSLGIPS